MISTLLHSYPARLLFLVAAIAAAAVIILFRVVFRDGKSLLRANH